MDDDITIPSGYILADKYPNPTIELQLPDLKIPKKSRLTIFTCPGKKEFAKPADFDESFLEWTTKRGTLRKTQLFPTG